MRLTIGKLASSSGVGSDTIRYYERIGLLEPPRRGTNGYRLYAEATAARVRFIKRAQALGFSLDEVAALLEFGSTPEATAGDVLGMTRAKIIELSEKIRELNELVGVLERVAEDCPGHDEPARDCPIIRYFAGDDDRHECDS